MSKKKTDKFSDNRIRFRSGFTESLDDIRGTGKTESPDEKRRTGKTEKLDENREAGRSKKPDGKREPGSPTGNQKTGKNGNPNRDRKTEYRIKEENCMDENRKTGKAGGLSEITKNRERQGRREPSGFDVRIFQQQESRHYRKMSFLWILLLVWLGVFLLSLFLIMSYRPGFFTLAIWLENVSDNIRSFFALLTGHGADNAVGKTLCQYLCVAITGAGLSACGAVFQGSFRNVLAGPSTMGVMSGGTLGCTLMLAFIGSGAGAAAVVTDGNASLAAAENITFFERYQMSFAVLIGCFGAVALVLAVATLAGRGKTSPSVLIVAGTVFSTVAGNVNMLLQYFMMEKNPSDYRIDIIRDLMMGSFNNAVTPAVVAMMGIPIGICLAILMALSGRLNLLSFGEDEARSMGLQVARFRIGIIVLGTVITAAVVSFCGHIGFLGFMVPLVARKISGPDMRRLLPASMLTGAILLTLIFDVARFLTLADSLNVITSPIGAVVLLVVLLKKKGAGNHGIVQTADLADMAGR